MGIWLYYWLDFSQKLTLNKQTNNDTRNVKDPPATISLKYYVLYLGFGGKYFLPSENPMSFYSGFVGESLVCSNWAKGGFHYVKSLTTSEGYNEMIYPQILIQVKIEFFPLYFILTCNIELYFLTN